jgi:prepilin-type N-terminal cleavage/methylation domain-containing protein
MEFFKPQKIQGFTLIEILVSVAVFLVASILGVGTLLSMTNAQNKAMAIRAAMDNIGFGFEVMTKEIRTGESFHCGISNFDYSTNPRDCAGGGPSFTFINALGSTVTYRAENGRLEKSSDGGTTFLPLTAPEVDVERIRFYVEGSSPSDTLQPKVTMVMGVKSGVRLPAEIDLQTTITQRRIDY